MYPLVPSMGKFMCADIEFIEKTNNFYANEVSKKENCELTCIKRSTPKSKNKLIYL